MSSMGLGDDYVNLYDLLEGLQRKNLVRDGDLRRWADDPTVSAMRESVTEHVSKTGRLEQHVPCEKDPKACFGTLLGLYDALQLLHPDNGDIVPGSLLELYRHISVECRLNRHTDGGLLFRRRDPPYSVDDPRTVAEYTSHIIRVPRHYWEQVHMERVRPLNDIGRPGILNNEAAGGFSVAQFPFLSNGSEIEFDLLVVDGKDFYSARPANHRDWDERIRGVLNLADSVATADLVLLPELAASDEILSKWQKAVHEIPRPGNSRLQWILIGSGPITRTGSNSREGDWPANRAVLIDRKSGKVIVTQDKMRPFTFDAKTRPHHARGESPLHEHITAGSTLNIIESEIGRFAILICNDLSHVEPVGEIVAALGVSHVLAPVATSPIDPTRHWVKEAARQLLGRAKCGVAVSNSFIFGRPLPSDRSSPATQTVSLFAAIPDLIGRRRVVNLARVNDTKSADQLTDIEDALRLRIATLRSGQA